MKIEVDPKLRAIAEAVGETGGRALLVGGRLRDHLLGLPAKDTDVEVFGLGLPELEAVLSRFGEVQHIGRAFGVLRIKGIDIDFSIPRRDSKVRPGHKGFEVTTLPEMSFAEASRRRDLTINSLGYDPITRELLDPHGGRDDLEKGILRATDPRHFPEDPLRALRVAEFVARFEMEPDETLLELCAGLDLLELSAERLFDQFNKILLKAERPSLAFEYLKRTDLLRFFPEIRALRDVAQEPDWHPEGDVFIHTMMVIDEAARLRRGDETDLALMYGALCHDFGKPATTEVIEGRIRSLSHDLEGVAIARAFLERLRAPKGLTEIVAVLVRHHLAPGLYYRNHAGAKAYRRLARELESAGATMELLLRVARSDHLGRTTAEARARQYPAGAHFEKQIALLELDSAPRDVVLGRHLIERGLEPGPNFSDILARCRDLQDETGWDDPDQILKVVLEENG